MSERLEDGTPTRLAVPCRRCGNWLVSKSSVEARLGPVCAQHERARIRRPANEIPLFELEAG
ncbi:DUF6011 domain-containing protein [Nocardia wallacei]|uniref:DUF6011 domain-containing protein n=1 Tax=Nocardia wallacei TaxID=480035 RepID=UPI002457ABB5|nr:DUF6011 domain-containing protein [Nocardia wallacei]